MLNKLLSLYLQSLVTTTILVGIASCIWIGYRALKKKDKTAKQRQAQHGRGILSAGELVGEQRRGLLVARGERVLRKVRRRGIGRHVRALSPRRRGRQGDARQVSRRT